MLAEVPDQVVTVDLPGGTQQVYRGVNGLDYEDTAKRRWQLQALQCLETAADGTTTRLAWVTGLPLNRQTVVAVAQRGGRPRGQIANEGFHRQKNSGMRLEHVYRIDPDKRKAYDLWLPLAHLLLLLLEQGS